jgi:putative DNA primase/helicase
MVVASEVPDGAVWNTQRIKDLTGNALITARGMRRDNETFARTMTLTLLGNSRPKIKNVDTAIKARLRIVPFDRDFETEGLADPQLPNELLKEAPGILRWAINGLLAVLKADGKIIEPVRVTEDTKDYLDKYDLRQQFVAERIEKAPNEETPIHDFYTAWKAFAEMRDIDPLNERSMSVWLVKLTGAKRGKPKTITVDGTPKENVKTLKGFKVKPDYLFVGGKK